MADPVTLATVGIASSAGSGILGFFGAQQEGEAQKRAYMYQAGIARMNAAIARQNADYSRKVGEVEAQQSGLKSKFQIGRLLTQQSGAGFDVNRGSNVRVRQSQGAIAQMDQRLIRVNAARRAYGYEVEAVNQDAEAQLKTMSGEYAEDAARIKGISSLLGAASSVSSKWLHASQTGIY